MAKADTLPQIASTHEDKKQPNRVGIIPISKIRQNVVALRPVKKESEDYLNLADSVKKVGVLTPITVREFQNPDNPKEMLYGIINGLQRYNAALDAGLTEIAALITDKEQAEIEEAQIILNAQTIETRPAEYADQIDRLLQRNPTLSIIELAGKLSKSTGWIYKMLGMVKRLRPELKPLVDDKKITLANAVELAKLPLEEQMTWSDKAQTMDTGEFTANVAARVKLIKEERKKGRAESPPTFEPVPNLRKVAELKNEFTNGAPMVVALLRRQKVTDPEKAAAMAMAWVVRMDPESQVEQREAHKAAEEKRKEEKDKKTIERQKQREDEARKTREDLEKKVADREKAPAAA